MLPASLAFLPQHPKLQAVRKAMNCSEEGACLHLLCQRKGQEEGGGRTTRGSHPAPKLLMAAAGGVSGRRWSRDRPRRFRPWEAPAPPPLPRPPQWTPAGARCHRVQ